MKRIIALSLLFIPLLISAQRKNFTTTENYIFNTLDGRINGKLNISDSTTKYITPALFFDSLTALRSLIGTGGGGGGTSQWTTSGSDIYNNNSGNVGIGISSPSHPLDVVGDINSGTRYLLSNGPTLVGDGISYNALKCPNDSYGFIAATGYTAMYNSNNATIIEAYVDGDSGVIFHDYQGAAVQYIKNGKLGILQGNPAYPLDLVGDLNITGNYLINGTPFNTAVLMYSDSGYKYITPSGLAAMDYLTSTSAASTYSVIGHTHTESDITGLASDLAAKLSATTAAATYSVLSHTHSYSSLTGIPSSFTPSAHTHTESDITGLVSDLAGKASSSHTHAQSDITGLSSSLASKLNISDTANIRPRLSAGTNIAITGVYPNLMITGANIPDTGSLSTRINLKLNISDTTKAIVEANYVDTITWTGVTAPSGTATNKYRYQRTGNVVVMELLLSFPNAGTQITAVVLDLPHGMPTPSSFTGFTALGSRNHLAIANIGTSTSAPTTPIGMMLRLKTNGSGWEFVSQSVSNGSYKTLWIQITYLI